MNGFSIRLAEEARGDIDFILRAHDSALDYLNKTVKSSQWGNELFSKRQKAIDVLTELVRESEKGLQGDQFSRTYIAESVLENDDNKISCGAAIIDAKFPEYVTNVQELKQHFQPSLDKNDFFYLDRLVSDRNAGKASKGAGKALLDHCKQIAIQNGKRFLFSDCFAGPPDGLRQYYQSQGFRILGNFGVPNKHVDGSDWPGVLLCFDTMNLQDQSDIYWKLDLTKSIHDSFTYDKGGHGWGNEELQTYTDSIENSFISSEGETLTIKAIADVENGNNRFTSARLVSKQCLDLERGYVEANIQTPQAKAIWYAFWLLPKQPFKWPEDGEIDVCEGWDNKYENGNCIHWGHFNGQDWDKHRVNYHPISQEQHQNGHTYGFCWSPEGLIWFFDGKPTMRAKVPDGIRSFADFQIILNIAMGGNVMKNAIPEIPSVHEMHIRDLKICRNPPMGWSKFEEVWNLAEDGNTM